MWRGNFLPIVFPYHVMTNRAAYANGESLDTLLSPLYTPDSGGAMGIFS